MTTEAKIQLTSSELGSIWETYLAVKGKLVIYDFFKVKIIDNEAKSIIDSFIPESQSIIKEIENIFRSENTAIPAAFDLQDASMEAPPLFDDILNIMFFRQMKKLNLGFDAVYTSISYEKEVRNILKRHYDISFDYYNKSTDYLLGKGVLVKPPVITMPNEAEFIENKNYMSGFNIFTDKRTLNTIEVGYLYESLEFNVIFMKVLTGFAQVASNSKVRKHFTEGKELAKKNIDKLSSVLLESDMQTSATWAGRVTDSKVSPFSDKLMMYIVSLMSTTPISYSALGTSFSFRNDLPPMLAIMAKDLFSYAKDGAKIMIENKWLEQPPQMEDRKQLIHSR